MSMHPWYRLSYQFGAILTKECRNCCQQPILNQNHVEPVQFSAVNVPFTSCNSFDRSSLGYNVSLQDIRLLLQSVTTVCLDHSSTVSILTSNIDWQLFGDISLIARNIPPRNILPRNIHFQYWLVTIKHSLPILTGDYLEDISQPFLPLLRKADTSSCRADAHLVSNGF